ncbi:MAG: PKD domain-containing protein, partial [Bacteroidales bacterium]|nr:PKD domain-containing protein [Bacteroidales bacterium]
MSLGFNHAENQTLVSSLISLAPSIGIETVPIVTIHGLSRVPKGCYNPYTALVDCVGEPSGYVWNLEGASFTYAVTEKVNVVWNSVGEYTVTLNVLNAAGNGSDTLVVNVFEWDWGDTLSYVLDEVEGCMGIDNVGTWGVRFPASAMCDRRQLDRVEVYMDTMSLGRLTMKVYQGGEAAPESLIYRKVTTISEAGWNSIDCGGGVCLDTSKCLWITFSSMASSPMAVVPYVGDSNSCMINVGEVWMPLYEYDPGNYDFEKSWMIRAVTSQYGTED